MIDIKKLFSHSWNIYKQNWLQVIAVTLLAFAVMLAIQSLLHVSSFIYNPIISVLVFGILYLVSIGISIAVAEIGLRKYFLGLVDGKEKKISDIFYGVDSVHHLLKFFGLACVIGVIALVGTLLFIIPGIIIGLGFMFMKYVAAENKLDFFDSMKYSWYLTRGFKWKLLWLFIVVIIFNILGALAVGLGLLITLPMTYLIFAKAFRDLEVMYNKKS